MKQVAKDERIAIKIAKNKLAKYGVCFYERITAGNPIECGCGETNSIKIIQKIGDDYHQCTVGYCQQCGTDYYDEISFSII